MTREECDNARRAAWTEYDRACAAALEIRDRAYAAAWAEYDAARSAVWRPIRTQAEYAALNWPLRPALFRAYQAAEEAYQIARQEAFSERIHIDHSLREGGA